MILNVPSNKSLSSLTHHEAKHIIIIYSRSGTPDLELIEAGVPDLELPLLLVF